MVITMTEQKCLFDFNCEELIQLKELRQNEIASVYFKLIMAEAELKNTENSLWLNTDFKALNLTNDKMRTAFVSDGTKSARFEINTLKYELKEQENLLIIINDLIKLRLQEVKTE